MTLEMWLQRATRGLSEDSAAQVRREVQEHYQAAQEDAVAECAAIVALGDPSVANHEYKKVLLTKAEARLLQDTKWEAQALCSRSWLKYALLGIPAFLPLVVSAAYWIGGATVARIMFAGGMIVSLLVVAPVLPIYTPARSRVFRVVKWVVIMGAICLAFGVPTLRAISGILPVLWTVAWMEWKRASIRRKLPVKQWPKPLYL